MFEPRSSRSGFAIINDIEYPIYSWNFSGRHYRSEYSTSASGGYLVRSSGLLESYVTIHGASPISFLTNFNTQGYDIWNIYVGWNEDDSDDRDAFLVYGVIESYTVQIRYSANQFPTISWLSRFLLVDEVHTTSMQDLPDTEIPHCIDQLCEKIVQTSDLEHNLGQIDHVLQATIQYSNQLNPYYTSQSDPIIGQNPFFVSPPLKDLILDYVVQGDFDYWVDLLHRRNTAYDYSHYFGSDVSEVYRVNKMKVLSIDNLMVDVSTGKISSASIHLGHSAYD